MHLKEKVKYTIMKSAAFALSSAMLIMSVPISVNAEETQYADGTFEGSGKGHVDTIVLDVTIANGKIVDIKTKQHNETPEYWEMAVPDMYNNIINKGDTAVDTISGATDSSNGIKDAVNQALEISASKATEDKNKIFIMLFIIPFVSFLNFIVLLHISSYFAGKFQFLQFFHIVQICI